MSNLTLVINSGAQPRVVAITYKGKKDSINLMGKSRAYLPLGAVVTPNYAILHSAYVKVYLPNTVLAAAPAAIIATAAAAGVAPTK